MIFFFILSYTAKGQSFFYSYIDPCSGRSKEITIPYGQNNVTVNYYGNVNTFNANDFNSGVFQTWVQNISQTNTNSPCDGVAVIVTNNINMTVTQNVVSTVMNITALTASLSDLSSSISSISGSASSMAVALDNSETGGSNGGGTKDNKKNGTNTNGGSSTTSNGSGNNSQAQTSNGNSNGTSGGSAQTGGTSQQSSNTTSAGSTTSQSPVGSSSTNNTGTNGTSNSSATGNSSTNNGSSSQSGNTTGGSTTNGSSNNSGQSSGQTTSGSANGSSVSSLNAPAGNSVGQNGLQSVNGGNTSTSTAPNSTSNGNINSNPSGTSTGSTNPANNTSSSKSTSEESSGSGSGSTSAALTNAEEGSSGGGGKKDGGEKKTGSMIGQGDLVVMQNADDPNAKNQVRFNTSITKANTDNTRVKGILVNYTSVVNNTNLTLYKAWVFKKSKLTLIAANSSMMNFERDFFNTSTAVVSKRYKGNWRKLTTMAGLNFTAGNYGKTPFMNASAVGGGFYAYKVNEKISGSLLIIGVYSPFTQFFDGKWWDSSTLIVPYSTWDFKLTKTFKLNVSFSGVYEMNKTMLNYQVLTGGKIMF